MTPQEKIDLFLDTSGRIVRGCLPLLLAGLGGSELFAPDFLASVHMAPDMAQTLFGAGLGAYGVNIGLPSGRKRGRK